VGHVLTFPMNSSLELASWVPQTQVDKDAVLAQLEKIVSHATLKSSKRCPALLRYIVEHQLQGEAGKLKERMIGIELFGRESDYDSNSDPVVRTTANDLRKRIAQYYHEPGHEFELKIGLPPGSYLAEFHLPDLALQETIPAFVAAGAREGSVAPRSTEPSSDWRRYTASAVLLVVTVIAIVWRQPARTPESLEKFWGTVAKTDPILVCVGTWSISSITLDTSPNAGISPNIPDLLPITDAVAFSRVSAFLGQTRTPFRVEMAKKTTLADLTQTPVVVIGGIDNQWTLRISDPLRFHFVHGGDPLKWAITDRKDGDHRFVSGGLGNSGGTKDYAIVGRLSNGTSGQMSVVVAGLGAAGTTAASEFVTDARYTDTLTDRDSNALAAKNLEVLISVDVVDGKPGAPRVEALETW
jgi:hypothetical protein